MLDRIRKHHAIEHAAVAVLMGRRHRPVSVVGFSDFDGFTLAGDFELAEVEAATSEAIRRMSAGERWLAVAAQCGTNLWVTGAMSALATLAVSRRKRPGSVSDAITASTLAALAAVPAGRWIQERFTVDPNVAGMQVRSVSSFTLLGRKVWRVRISS